MSIKKKLISGAIWNSVSQFGSQAINLVLTLVLAKLLTPADFGLLGQVAVMTSFLAFFTEFGITPSLIQKKNPDQTDCDTAFYSMFIFSITGYIIVFFLAPAIGVFYNNDKLVLITRILFIQFLIGPLAFVNEALERKNLSFNIIAFADIVSLLFSGPVGLVLAYMGFGVWSLVWQPILRILIRSVFIFMATKWKPGIKFSLPCFVEYVKHGAHFTYRNITLYLNENTDFLLIGKLLGPAMLGIYTLAFRLSNYPFTKVQQIFGTMLFPAFHSFNDDMDKIRNSYLKMTAYGACFLIPILILIFFGIGPLVDLLLGQKWIETVPIVKILVVYLVFSCISFADETVLIALFKIKVVNKFKTISSFFLVTAGYFAILKYGVIGMAYVFTIVSILCIIAIKILVIKALNMSLIPYFKQLKEPLVLVVVFFLIMIFFDNIAIGLSLSSFVYLIGEGLILIIVMTSFLIWKGFLNVKNLSIHPEVL